MDKLGKKDGASPDLVAENIERLRELFPEVFADGHIDFDALKETLGEYVDDREERYSFTWHGKSEARRIAQKPSMGTLRPCPEESVNWDTTKNIFIEGDNLEVLKLLQKSYHRKVKMIYIDPPYNTGSQFIYPDKFKDNLETYLRYTGQVDDEGFKLSANSETSGRYHTNWLNMMYPRLKLARNLLRDDGVIFVSIDDHEVQNLRQLLDEIFGAENFQAAIVIQANKRGQTYKDIAKTHEYVLVYGKGESTRLGELEKVGGTLPFNDVSGPFDAWELRNRNPKFGRHNRPNLFFPVYANPDSVDELGFARVSLEHSGRFSVEILPLNSEGVEGCWRWGKQRILNSRLDSETPEIVAKQKRDGGWNLYQKSRKNTTKAKSIWTETSVISEQGTGRMRQLELAGVFDHPKPVALIEKCLKISCEANDIVLDFFAGAATTGDAVVTLNSTAGHSLRFILVQLPEPCATGSEAANAGHGTIADIGKERIRRVIAKHNADGQEQNLLALTRTEFDAGFRVFTLASSNIKPWDADFDTMDDDLLAAIENIKPDRSEQDVLYELLLKYGLDLATAIETRTIADRTVTVIGAGALVVCLASDISLEVVAGIAALKDELQPEVMRVVFKDTGFANDVVKTNAAQILKQAGIHDVKSL